MSPTEFPYLLTIIRLLVPFLITKWPLAGTLLSILCDALDWKFFPFHTDSDYAFYQQWDKLMDLWYWAFIVQVIWRWSDRPVRRLALFLFGYRLVGMLLFFLTGWRIILAFFPNFFENFFIFYLLYMKMFKRTELFTAWPISTVIGAALFLPKFFQEVYQHYLLQQPWEVYNVGHWLNLTGAAQEYTNYFVWGGLLYGVPLVALLLFLRWQQDGLSVFALNRQIHS